MVLHPHIHCLVTEGGLKGDRWMETRQKGYLLPIEAVMMVFRGKLLDSLHKAIGKGTITLPHEMSLKQWKNLRNKLGRKPWNVHIRERYDHGRGILIYLARYIRGGAMANRRIVSSTDKGVAFTYKTSDRSKRESMTLPPDQFIQRYLLHVPHPSTKVVRYYGLYAPTARVPLSFCRSLFDQDALKEPEPMDWQNYCDTKGDEHPERCPVCGSRLIRLMDIPRSPRFTVREAICNAA
jgi:hypothetical protein